jgi:malate dehydrogenase (oxaloacetate-decarboxylating)
MKIAAVHAIAVLVTTEELNANYVIPDSFDPRVAAQVAAAVAKSAIETNIGQKVVHAD